MQTILARGLLLPAHPNRILHALSADDLLLLLSSMREVSLEHGTVLHEQDDIVQDIYFPHNGLISLTAVMSGGTAPEMGMIGREGACGLLAGLGQPRALGRAMVQIACTASRMPVSQFGFAAEQSRSLRCLALNYTAFQMAQFRQTAACNALHDLDSRLCGWLLHAHDAADGQPLKITQEFLAELLGVRRTSVTVVDRSLQDAGLIRYRRGVIEIIDRGSLELRSCECYAALQREYAQMLS
jgi:CRP-like cAMP-binding protein